MDDVSNTDSFEVLTVRFLLLSPPSMNSHGSPLLKHRLTIMNHLPLSSVIPHHRITRYIIIVNRQLIVN